jgi:formamidopyrimidine-DNA glycosylase
MPELPDVEGFRRVLAEHAAGRRIERVEVRDPAVLRNARPEPMARSLRGRRFREPERRGKWLLAHTDGPTVLFHFGMSGALLAPAQGEERHRHDRIVFTLDGGELRYRDQRKLQGTWLAKDAGQAKALVGPLGPDALDISRGELRERLTSRHGQVKAALMDQELVAGLGNILADEILWQAQIHPRRPPADLGEEDWDRLHRSLSRVLHESVQVGHVPTPPSWLTGVRDRDAPSCPRCHTALEVTRVGGRSTYSCPRCQPGAGRAAAGAS